MVTRVVMNGRRRARVTSSPLTTPAVNPTAIPVARPAVTPSGLALAAATLASAATAPTDRSMPPVMMTKHMPSETRANIALVRHTLITLYSDRKLS